MTPSVAAVIVSYNTRDLLRRCLDTLRAVTLPLEIVVVDNASTDGSAEAVRDERPDVRVIANAENVGFARANNRGIAETTAPLVLVLNSDAFVQPGAVEAMASRLQRRPRAALAGPRTLSGDGSVQVSFGPDLTLWSEWRQRRLVHGVRRREPKALRRAEAMASREWEPDWVSASCFLARRDALAQVGGFDEGFFLYEEDVDLCTRLRAAGYTILFVPEAVVVHTLGQSMEQAATLARNAYRESHLRYYRKHRGKAQTTLLRLWTWLRESGAP